ncbi:CNNM domain-containing protein [Micromonospora sp. M12]
MGGQLGQLALVAVLVLINAALSGSEMALVTLREGQLRRLGRRSRAGDRLVQLSGTRTGTWPRFSSASPWRASSPRRRPPCRWPSLWSARSVSSAGGAARRGAAGDRAADARHAGVRGVGPKRLAMQRAERWALLSAGPLDLLARVSRPAVWLLSRATDVVVRLAGGDPRANREEMTEEELREMLASQRGLSAQQREILTGAFDIAGRTLREILVARREVTTLPADLSADEGATPRRRRRSRAPVTGPGGLDEVLGVVHIRDLVRAGAASVGERVRPPLLLPVTLPVADALRQLRQEHQQLALVVDEHGGIDGMVTMEDLLAEVVGELYDETDRDVRGSFGNRTGPCWCPVTSPARPARPGVRLSFPLSRDYTTVAGLVLARLRHLPDAPGETVRLPGLTLQVVEVADRAVRRVRLCGFVAER